MSAPTWADALGVILTSSRVCAADVEACVSFIEAVSGDDEAAHSREDTLRGALLMAIADGRCFRPDECAQAALATAKLDFKRWCA